MIMDEAWWAEFWESDAGKLLKALGGYDKAHGVDTIYLIRAHYNKPKAEIPEVYTKAFEGEDDN